MRVLGLLVAALVLASVGPTLADKPTEDDARAITLEASAIVRSEGAAAARKKFMVQGSRFLQGEIYVNVIDENGTWIIYPPNPKNEGRSVYNVRDADGKLLVQEIVAVAREKGEGWVRYRWLNPASNKIEPKVTFVKHVPEQGLIVYVGVYKD